MKYLSHILALVAGCLYGAMATLQFHFSTSVFAGINDQFWNSQISWMNKYKTALPVAFTDGWHLLQSLFLITIFGAIIFYKRNTYLTKFVKLNLAIDFILLRALFGLGFVLMYDLILIK